MASGGDPGPACRHEGNTAGFLGAGGGDPWGACSSMWVGAGNFFSVYSKNFTCSRSSLGTWLSRSCLAKIFIFCD